MSCEEAAAAVLGGGEEGGQTAYRKLQGGHVVSAPGKVQWCIEHGAVTSAKGGKGSQRAALCDDMIWVLVLLTCCYREG